MAVDVLAGPVTGTEINRRPTSYLPSATEEAGERLHCARGPPWLWRAAADRLLTCLCRVRRDRRVRRRRSSRPRPPHGRLWCLEAGGGFHFRFGGKGKGGQWAGRHIVRMPARTR